MKNITILLLLLFSTFCFAQQTNPEYDEALAKSLKGNDNGMKAYVFCILKTGSNTTATDEEKAKLFEGHMANIKKLAAEGKLVVAGPFGDDGNWRGIFIFDTPTMQETEQIIKTDPAVIIGRLIYEIHPWWTMQGTVFK